MFTGLITHLGTIVEISADRNQITLRADLENWQIGESIALDGCCLTLVEFSDNLAKFNLSPETLNLTYFSKLEVGSQINLERPLTVGQHLGGHFVTGHIDQTAQIQKITQQNDYYIIKLTGFSHQHLKWCVPKGSICVNGISLTINQVHTSGVELCIIPHTWAVTNLSQFSEGTEVNIEFDYSQKLSHDNNLDMRHEPKK